jgi:hypothetical protein
MARYIAVTSPSFLLGIEGASGVVQMVVDTEGPLYTVDDAGHTARAGLVRAIAVDQDEARDIAARLNAI